MKYILIILIACSCAGKQRVRAKIVNKMMNQGSGYPSYYFTIRWDGYMEDRNVMVGTYYNFNIGDSVLYIPGWDDAIERIK